MPPIPLGGSFHQSSSSPYILTGPPSDAQPEWGTRYWGTRYALPVPLGAGLPKIAGRKAQSVTLMPDNPSAPS